MVRESFADFYLSCMKKGAEERSGEERERILKRIERYQQAVPKCIEWFEERHETKLNERERAIFTDAFFYGLFELNFQEMQRLCPPEDDLA
ncbi:MAG: hypothetical protein IRZ03_19315 [Acidobacterium ailaaui]|nr:hypothetical protein [Pseudacidobacterium ailaaui]